MHPRHPWAAATLAATLCLSASATTTDLTGTVTRHTTPAQRADQSFNAASALVTQARFLEAQTQLEQVLRIDPLHHSARQLLAQVCLAQGRVDQAQHWMTEGLRLTPQRIEFAMILAQAHLHRAKVADAVEALELVMPFALGYADFYGFLAALQQLQGHHEVAMQHYVSALHTAPDDANWWVGLGISLQAQRLNQEAAHVYGRAMEVGVSPMMSDFVQRQLLDLGQAKN